MPIHRNLLIPVLTATKISRQAIEEHITLAMPARAIVIALVDMIAIEQTHDDKFERMLNTYLPINGEEAHLRVHVIILRNIATGILPLAIPEASHEHIRETLLRMLEIAKNGIFLKKLPIVRDNVIEAGGAIKDAIVAPIYMIKGIFGGVFGLFYRPREVARETATLSTAVARGIWQTIWHYDETLNYAWRRPTRTIAGLASNYLVSAAIFRLFKMARGAAEAAKAAHEASIGAAQEATTATALAATDKAAVQAATLEVTKQRVGQALSQNGPFRGFGGGAPVSAEDIINIRARSAEAVAAAIEIEKAALAKAQLSAHQASIAVKAAQEAANNAMLAAAKAQEAHLVAQTAAAAGQTTLETVVLAETDDSAEKVGDDALINPSVFASPEGEMGAEEKELFDLCNLEISQYAEEEERLFDLCAAESELTPIVNSTPTAPGIAMLLQQYGGFPAAALSTQNDPTASTTIIASSK